MSVAGILSFADRIKPFEDKLGTVYVQSDYSEEQKSGLKIDIDSLIEIIKNVGVFLDLDELAELRVLNKQIGNEFLTEELYAHICCLRLKFTSPNKLIPSMIKNHFADITGYYCASFEELFNIIIKSKNLVKNSAFDEDFNQWNVIQGGNGPEIGKDEIFFKGKKNLLKTSFRWSGVSQCITLPEMNNRTIVGGAIAASRVDCGSEFSLKLSVGEGEKSTQIRLPDNKPGLSLCEWNLISQKLSVQDDATEAKIELLGKDTKFWAGVYGAQIVYAFVYSFKIPAS